MANTLRILPSVTTESRGTKDTRVSERIVTLVPVSSPEAKAASMAGAGWDAYEVWRRLIKDARDRRENRCS